MALRLTLKPNEHVLIGGAALRNGGARATLYVENRVPVLREADVLGPRAVRTPCERIYLALELAYLEPTRRPEHLAAYRTLADEVSEAAPSCRRWIRRIDAALDRGADYPALRDARRLRQHERRILERVS
jgi:flagellar protein FlbT